MFNSDEKETAYDALDSAVLQLEKAKLILTAQKISWILNTIASSEVLIKMTSEAMAGFDYQRELTDAFYTGSDRKTYFKLPPSPKKAVALMISMLYDFDNGTMNFVEFITGAFQGVRTEDCYKAFTENVCEAFLSHAKGLIFQERETVITDTEKLDEQFRLVNSSINDKADELLKKLLDMVNEYPMLEELDVKLMLEAISHAMDIRDIKLIKAVFVGLKRFLRDYDMFYGTVGELESVLRMYSVK